MFPKAGFKVTGEPKVYENTKTGSGQPVLHFCGNCGVTLWTSSPRRPDVMIVKTGVLDEGAFARILPKAEAFTAQRPDWLKSVDGSTQFEGAFSVQPSQAAKQE